MNVNNNTKDRTITNWPTFDNNTENCPANRLYVTELPENARPGIQRKDQKNQDLILKFDWYFSTTEAQIRSKEFFVPNSGKTFMFESRSSPSTLDDGKQIEVFLVNSDDFPENISLEYNVVLRTPDWEEVKELRGCQEFNCVFRYLDLFRIAGKSVDVWPSDQDKVLTSDGIHLIPKVYGIKGTLKVLKDRVQNNWKLLTEQLTQQECHQLKLIEDDN